MHTKVKYVYINTREISKIHKKKKKSNMYVFMHADTEKMYRDSPRFTEFLKMYKLYCLKLTNLLFLTNNSMIKTYKGACKTK